MSCLQQQSPVLYRQQRAVPAKIDFGRQLSHFRFRKRSMLNVQPRVLFSRDPSQRASLHRQSHRNRPVRHVHKLNNVHAMQHWLLLKRQRLSRCHHNYQPMPGLLFSDNLRTLQREFRIGGESMRPCRGNQLSNICQCFYLRDLQQGIWALDRANCHQLCAIRRR